MYNKQLLHAFQSPTWLNSHPNAENFIQLLWHVWQLLDAIKSFQFSKYLKAEAVLASCDLARPHLKAHPWYKHLLAVVKSQDINNGSGRTQGAEPVCNYGKEETLSR